MLYEVITMADAFVLEEFQGKGLGQWLLGCVVAHPDLEGLRRFLVLTPNAHDLYHKYGFQPLAHPEQMLEIFNPDIYRDAPRPSRGSEPGRPRLPGCGAYFSSSTSVMARPM